MNVSSDRDAEVILLAPPASPDALALPEFRLDLNSYFDIFNAAELGLTDRVNDLLESDPRLARAKNAEGKTALLLAVQRGHKATADLLLEFGADVNARDLLMATPLHRTAQLGRAALVSFLLERGADPMAKDLWKKTPLERALAANRLDVAQLLRLAI